MADPADLDGLLQPNAAGEGPLPLTEPVESTDDELTDLLFMVRRQIPEEDTPLPGIEPDENHAWPPEVTSSLRILDRGISETLREREMPVT